MRNKIFSLILIATFTLASYATSGENSSENVSEIDVSRIRMDYSPSIGIEKAIELVRQYVKAKRINMNGQYIRSAKLEYDSSKSSKGQFWEVQWEYKRPTLGRIFIFRVFMDGSVVEAHAGP